ncbi:hypothetical protein NAI82_10970, partial [Oxalobacter sp. JAC-2022]|uniref:hypothetical protein n=1 Tax=Oxalobacter aliiformigenes TaxID=2946593 RepID=UPI0022AEEE4B
VRLCTLSDVSFFWRFPGGAVFRRCLCGAVFRTDGRGDGGLYSISLSLKIRDCFPQRICTGESVFLVWGHDVFPGAAFCLSGVLRQLYDSPFDTQISLISRFGDQPFIR